MKLLQSLILLIFLVLTIQCDPSDSRLKIINISKKEKIISFCIKGFETCSEGFGELSCTIPDSLLNSRIFLHGDTLCWPRNGPNSWLSLEKKDTVVVYVFDKIQFKQCCKGILPYDSCYIRLAYTKDALVKANWIIRIDK